MIVEPVNLRSLSTILVTGATGQDGTIAGQIILGEGRHAVGLVRQGRSPNQSSHPIEDWREWDWETPEALESILEEIQPDAILHLAAHHHSATAGPEDAVQDSAKMLSTNLTAFGHLVLAMQKTVPKAYLVSAASSQMFTVESPGQVINEQYSMHPGTMYGVTKLATLNLLDFFRRQGRLIGGTAILFNHESRYRPPAFLSRIISMAAAEISAGERDRLVVRNIGAAADWFAAEDAVRAMLTMAALKLNEDFIVASGKPTTVRELLDAAFEYIGLDWRNCVSGEQDKLSPFPVGNPMRLEEAAGWKASIPIRSVMEEMVAFDQSLLAGGHQT